MPTQSLILLGSPNLCVRRCAHIQITKGKEWRASLFLWSAETQEPSNRETHITESWALGLLELAIISNKLITIYKGSWHLRQTNKQKKPKNIKQTDTALVICVSLEAHLRQSSTEVLSSQLPCQVTWSRIQQLRGGYRLQTS